jgi:hypothetical protein
VKSIEKQIALVSRIKADLTKEAHAHKSKRKDAIASYCINQADALSDVLDTLKGVLQLQEGLGLLLDTPVNKPTLPITEDEAGNKHP